MNQSTGRVQQCQLLALVGKPSAELSVHVVGPRTACRQADVGAITRQKGGPIARDNQTLVRLKYLRGKRKHNSFRLAEHLFLDQLHSAHVQRLVGDVDKLDELEIVGIGVGLTGP